ncbi:hypothetical protein ON010_g3805 [Phytophthora cinnamomi]|nr:hypothetical protein ON010_g3805 [Phytophthora cinnamomi]
MIKKHAKGSHDRIVGPPGFDSRAASGGAAMGFRNAKVLTRMVLAVFVALVRMVRLCEHSAAPTSFGPSWLIGPAIRRQQGIPA